jgi:hypothetical protein
MMDGELGVPLREKDAVFSKARRVASNYLKVDRCTTANTVGGTQGPLATISQRPGIEGRQRAWAALFLAPAPLGQSLAAPASVLCGWAANHRSVRM